MENPSLELAAILAAAVGAQLLAARFRLPAIVPLLVAGVLSGPYVIDVIDPNALLGELIDPIVALAVGRSSSTDPSRCSASSSSTASAASSCA